MSMPDFDDAVAPQPTKRKPRKPMKKRRKMRKARKMPATVPVLADESTPKKRRKYTKRANGQIGKRNYTKSFSSKQYEVIGSLLNMTAKERADVFNVVKGLAK